MRTFALKATAGAYVSAGIAASAEVVTYPQRLVTLGRKLLDDEEFGISIVVAHLAAEIAAGRKITEAFAARGIADLEESVSSFFSGSNLSNDRIRQLYTALTGDDLAAQPFWAEFRDSARRRNKVAHEGVTASRAEAETAIAAATALIKHLGKCGDTA